VSSVVGGLPIVPFRVLTRVDTCDSSSQTNSMNAYLWIGAPLLGGASQAYLSTGGEKEANVLMGAAGGFGAVPGLAIKKGDKILSPIEFTAEICTSYLIPGANPESEQSVANA